MVFAGAITGGGPCLGTGQQRDSRIVALSVSAVISRIEIHSAFRSSDEAIRGTTQNGAWKGSLRAITPNKASVVIGDCRLTGSKTGVSSGLIAVAAGNYAVVASCYVVLPATNSAVIAGRVSKATSDRRRDST